MIELNLLHQYGCVIVTLVWGCPVVFIVIHVLQCLVLLGRQILTSNKSHTDIAVTIHTECVAVRCRSALHGAARRLASCESTLTYTACCGVLRHSAAHCGTVRPVPRGAATQRFRCERIFTEDVSIKSYVRQKVLFYSVPLLIREQE